MFAVKVVALFLYCAVADNSQPIPAVTTPTPVPAVPIDGESVKHVDGKVLRLRDVLKRHGADTDDDASKLSRVIECADGKIYTLVKDEGSRRFFLDDRMLERDVHLEVVQIPGTQSVVIKKVQTIVDGKVYDVDYWCETCELSYTQPGLCICCGQQTELRELPAKSK